MKSSSSSLGAFSARVAQSGELREMTSSMASTSSLFPNTELGAPLRQQFEDHVHALLPHEIDEMASQFIDPLLAAVGQFAVQPLLLRARVAFTRMVETAVQAGQLFKAEAVIRKARAAIIGHLASPVFSDARLSLNALQTLVQEQQHTVASLLRISDATAAWHGEMRFYEKQYGCFESCCSGFSATVDAAKLDVNENTVLVTTEVTKRIRRAFFRSVFGGSGLLHVDGVAGTGKTETIKDICVANGMTLKVVNKNTAVNADDWFQLAQTYDMLVLDEGQDMQLSALDDLIAAARKARVPLCITSNTSKQLPGKLTLDDIRRAMGTDFEAVTTEVPHFPLIMSSMLACEGLQHADELADRLDGLMTSLKTNCSKQTYYDFGLRKTKSICKEAGKQARSSTLSDERQIMTAAIQAQIAGALAPVDEEKLTHAVVEYFGEDAFVPMVTPADFWNAAATKISRTVASRHGSMVLEADTRFAMAVVDEEAAKVGAETVCMSGLFGAQSSAELFGDFHHGMWTDGSFAKALREVVTSPRPSWLVVPCGNAFVQQEKFNELNTLLDDNKTLVLASGERLHLKQEDRIVFIAPRIDASPATVSRLGIANLGVKHRHRM